MVTRGNEEMKQEALGMVHILYLIQKKRMSIQQLEQVATSGNSFPIQPIVQKLHHYGYVYLVYYQTDVYVSMTQKGSKLLNKAIKMYV